MAAREKTEIIKKLVLITKSKAVSYQGVWPELEVDEEDVAVDGAAAKVVQVQVLHYLPQVGVDDVGQERVEHPDLFLPGGR